MESFTNTFGITFRVGDLGEIRRNFSKNQNPKQVRIVSFTPSGNYMRCEDERGGLWSFSTATYNLKGSHMGNTYISFRGFEEVNAPAPAKDDFSKQYDLIPEDYEIIGWAFPEPDCDDMGQMYTIPVLDYNEHLRDGDVSEEQDEWLRSIVGTSSTCCNHCGKRMKYFAIIAHLESRELHIIGTQCASSMLHYSQDVVDGMHKATLKARQRANRVQKKRKARANAEAFIDGVDGLRDALKTDHYIVDDIGFKLMEFGSISDKQVELVFKIQQQVEERKREQAAREAAGAARKHFGKVGERIRSHSIKCVFSKSFDGDFGTWYLVKFEDAAGNQFVYRGSAYYRMDQEYVASFTIKDHSEFRGEKQTIVSRIHLHECV